MDDPLCRVSIQCADAARAVDVALPRHAVLGMLLPDIVDLVIGGDAHPPDAASGWRLDRIGGGRCDESMSLHETGIVDGDVVVLSTAAAPPPGPLPQDVFRTVAGADARRETPTAPAGAWAAAGAVAAVALGYSGAAGATPVALAVAAAAAVGCVLIARRSAPAMRLAVQACAVGFSCVTGFLTVPAPAGPPGVVLGSAAGCAASVWLLRACAGDVRFFTATATALALLTTVSAPALLPAAGLGAQGAALGVLALGMLTVAGRLAMAVTDLRPTLPGPNDNATPASISDEAAAHGRDVFTGLVTGSAAAATLAVGMIAVGSAAGPSWPQGGALAAAISAVLLLRMRLYADPACRAVSGRCALLGAAATVALVTVSAPRYAGPAAVLAVALAGRWYAGRARRAPSWSRTADIIEYLLIAAVVPLACWVAGLYHLVRSSSIG